MPPFCTNPGCDRFAGLTLWACCSLCRSDTGDEDRVHTEYCHARVRRVLDAWQPPRRRAGSAGEASVAAGHGLQPEEEPR